MESPYQPPRAALTAPPDPSLGTWTKGILLGAGTLIGGYVIAIGLLVIVMLGLGKGAATPGNGFVAGALFGNILPWGALLALIVRYALRNEMRTVYGLIAAVGGLFVLCLLIGVVAIVAAVLVGLPHH